MKVIQRTILGASFVCLGLSIIMIVAWVRSYWRADKLDYVCVATSSIDGSNDYHFGWFYSLISSRGGIGFTSQQELVGTTSTGRSWIWSTAGDALYPYCDRRPFAANIRGTITKDWVPTTTAYYNNISDFLIIGQNPPSPDEYLLQGFGFTFAAAPTARDWRPRIVILPYWAALGVLGCSATIAVRSLNRQFRVRMRPNPHACPTCGYDLRATPDRCPECGRVPSAIEQGAA
jgi:hypothetical protein